MGKFGKRRLPRFMEQGTKSQDSEVNEMGGMQSDIFRELIEDLAKRPDLWYDLGFSDDATLDTIIDYLENSEYEEFNQLRREFYELEAMKPISRMNECWQPITEDYIPGLSDSSKQAIKSVCEEVLIHEAHLHDMSPDDTQTYATYMNECYQYMTECMVRAAQNLKM